MAKQKTQNLKYSNPALPKVVRARIEGTIILLVDDARLVAYSRNEFNSQDHITMVSYRPAYDAVTSHLFLDMALEDDEVAALIKDNKQFKAVIKHAQDWLAQTVRAKYPARKQRVKNHRRKSAAVV